MLPAGYVIAEHYALGSTAAILSRSFCAANTAVNPADVEQTFVEGVKKIREKEVEVAQYTQEQYAENFREITRRVEEIIHQ